MNLQWGPVALCATEKDIRPQAFGLATEGFMPAILLRRQDFPKKDSVMFENILAHKDNFQYVIVSFIHPKIEC